MKMSKIVLLIVYVAFMATFIIGISGFGEHAAGQQSRSSILFVSMLPFFFIALGVAGGFAARGADRNVGGWVVGCVFVPWILPVVLVFLRAAPDPVARKSSAQAGEGADRDRDRKLDELSALKAKGILTQAEYDAAVRKVRGEPQPVVSVVEGA